MSESLIRRLKLFSLCVLLGLLLVPDQVDAAPARRSVSTDQTADPIYAPWVHQADLTQSSTPGAIGDVLAVSEDGNTIVAGVPDAYLHDDDVGLVRIYVKPEKGGWEDAQETATLTASDGTAIDYFGSEVAISTDLIAVGLDTSTDIYVFVKPVGGWVDMTETAKLSFGGNIPGDSIAIMGDSILAGATSYYDGNPDQNIGAVFVWNKPTGGWADTDSIDAILTPGDGHKHAHFGNAMAASGDTLVVGAGSDAAGSYIFVQPANGWRDMTETAKLSPSNMSETSLFGGGFGQSVAIDGGTVLIGAPYDDRGDDSGTFQAGAAYLYERPSQGWTSITETAIFTASVATLPNGHGVRFGRSVAISGGMAAVGNEHGSRAYVFEKPQTGWRNMSETTFFPPNQDDGTVRSYGAHILLHGNTLLVGDISGGFGNDRIRVYRRPPDRPVMVIPGILGSYYFSDATHEQWNVHRGVHPDLLLIDPLTHAYDDLVQTLKNVGYEEGKELFVVAYDWRLTPGPSDGVYDGRISGLTGRRITDVIYEYGVDYLGYHLKEAAIEWERTHPDEPLESVDIISHSTGGLVARSYIQSDAYGDSFVAPGGKTLPLPKVENLIMVAVPNRGASQPWQAMQNNFIIDFSSKYVIAKILNIAYQKVVSGQTITGFPADITLATISPLETPNRMEFIAQYVPTFRSLLATYDFLYDDDGDLRDVNDWPDVRNDLVLDLNNGLDLPDRDPPTDPSPFANLVVTTSVFYADTVFTEYRVRHKEVAASNVVFPFTAKTEQDVSDGFIWYQGIAKLVGDGTVPRESSVGQFANDGRIQGYRVGTDNHTHTGLMSNFDVQGEILDILAVDWLGEQVSTGKASTEHVSAIWNAYIDPVDMVLVDGNGRRFGHTEETGPLTEMPNSVWYGGSEGLGWILGNVTPPLSVELTGLGETYHVQVSGAQPDMAGGYESSGFLEPGEKKSATVDVTTRSEHSVFFPIVAKKKAPPPQTLLNGDFEQGSTGWDEFSSTEDIDLIVAASELPVPPHSGEWAVWLGGVFDDESRIEQRLTVPATRPYLNYWHWIASTDPSCSASGDVGSVFVGAEVADTLLLCGRNETGGWMQRSVNLSAWKGETISLAFYSSTNEADNSNLFVDDVSFTSGARSMQVEPMSDRAGGNPRTTR